MASNTSSSNIAITPNSKRNLELDLDFLERRHNENSTKSAQNIQANSSPIEISPESVDRVKVILLGAPAVGKTSIIQQFVWNDFCEEYIPTDRKHTYYPSVITNERLYEIKIIDIPVIPYFPVNSYYEWANYRYYGLRSATAYILVFDLSNIETFQYIRTIREQICESRNMTNVPILVVGNKQDLVIGIDYHHQQQHNLNNQLLSSASALTTNATGCCSSSSMMMGGGGGGGGCTSTTTIGGGVGGGGSTNNQQLITINNKTTINSISLDEKRRDIINLVKKHWKCGYIECSAKYNWKVVSLFKELINMIDNLDSRDQSPMLDNIQEALDRNKCVVI